MTRYFQYVLFFLAFITFGLGDALTAATMMETRGSIIESNIVYAYIYETQGSQTFVITKIYFVVVTLMFIFIYQHFSKEKIYWKVNGLLMALTIVGTMAMIANMEATIGHAYLNPEYIIVIYIIMAIIFISIGDYIDKCQHAIDNATNEV